MHGEIREEDSEKLSLWARRKKKIRVYMLTNTYVPLVRYLGLSFTVFRCSHPDLLFSQLFRFVNITFTTAALGMAIRIRIRERRHHVMGAVGVSPLSPFHASEMIPF